VNFSSQRTVQRFRPVFALLAVAVSGVISAPAPALGAVPTLSINDVSITEGDIGTLTLTFQVTASARGKSSVQFTTAAGSATSPADFVARSGKLKFAGHNTKKNVAITIVGDTLDEANEHFFVRLSNPVGATIADGEGEGTINDNDAPPSVSTVATLTVPEGNIGDTPFATIDVSLSAVSGRNVSVEYGTVDVSATEGSDYDQTSGTLTFAPGETAASLSVSVIGDEDAEGDETFDVDLSNPVNATLGTHPSVVTIQDNDPIPVGSAVFNVTGKTVREGSSGTTTLTFTITRSGETTTVVNVDYFTTNGKAVAPGDYAAASGNLPFASGVTTATVQVQVTGDKQLEHLERFFLSLVNPSAGSAIEHGQAIGKIRDDDTWTRFAVTKAHGRIRVSGRLSPAHPNKRVVVTLSRRINGSWVKLGVKRPVLTGRSDVNHDGYSDSRFVTQFNRPRPGTCRIVARFRGDASHSPSSATKRFAC
jgi:Calx-beta domain